MRSPLSWKTWWRDFGAKQWCWLLTLPLSLHRLSWLIAGWCGLQQRLPPLLKWGGGGYLMAFPIKSLLIHQAAFSRREICLERSYPKLRHTMQVNSSESGCRSWEARLFCAGKHTLWEENGCRTKTRKQEKEKLKEFYFLCSGIGEACGKVSVGFSSRRFYTRANA